MIFFHATEYNTELIILSYSLVARYNKKLSSP